MAKRIEHYEYLAQDRIRNLYQQIHSGRWHDFPIEVSPSVPFIGQITVSKPSGKEPSLPQQLQAVVKHLQKHQPGDIGTVDMPKRYILGTLPVFSHFLPQEPKVNVAAIPEFIYYGGSTETTILG